jgi:DNA-binding winged helix-turn-helix (wHTH) protein/TolB-like protein
VHYRFGVFEFESTSGELLKSARRVPLEPQPARALALLLARADQLVTRDELKDVVWGKDTHVDFDRGLAYCLSQIRIALGDAGDSPRFVQTIPKQGYRFIAPVHVEPPHVAHEVDAPEHSKAAGIGGIERSGWRDRRWSLVLLSVLCLSAGLAGGLALRDGRTPAGRVVVAVSIFDNETGLAEYDRLVSGLSDVVVTRLTGLAPDRVAVIGNAAVLRQPRNIRNLQAVAAGVRADYVLLGQLQHVDTDLRFITHVIRLSDGTHLKANRLSFPQRDVTSLEEQVVSEFERALRQHILSGPSSPR